MSPISHCNVSCFSSIGEFYLINFFFLNQINEFFICALIWTHSYRFESKIQLIKACWISLFNSILAKVKFPVILIIKINKKCIAKHFNNRTSLKTCARPPGEACLPVSSVVEWLKHRTDDQHGLGSKPTCAILLCSWERHFTALSPAWWS